MKFALLRITDSNVLASHGSSIPKDLEDRLIETSNHTLPEYKRISSIYDNVNTRKIIDTCQWLQWVQASGWTLNSMARGENCHSFLFTQG